MSEIIAAHASGKTSKVTEKMHQSPIVEVFVKVMNRLKIKEARDGYESFLLNM